MEKDSKGDEDADEKSGDESNQQSRWNEFTQKLEQCVNRDKVDQAAVDFCYLNGKANRKKLVNVSTGMLTCEISVIYLRLRLCLAFLATNSKFYPTMHA